MRFSMHSSRTLAALLLIALIAFPILLSACAKKDVTAPEEPVNDDEQAARKNAKMNDPAWGDGKQGADKMGDQKGKKGKMGRPGG